MSCPVHSSLCSRASWQLLFLFTFHTACAKHSCLLGSVSGVDFRRAVLSIYGLWKAFCTLFFCLLLFPKSFPLENICFYITKVSFFFFFFQSVITEQLSFSYILGNGRFWYFKRHILVWLVCLFNSHTFSANEAVSFITGIKWFPHIVYVLGPLRCRFSGKKCDACSMEDSRSA